MTLEETIGCLIAEHKEKVVARAIEKVAGRLAKSCLPHAETQLKVAFETKIQEIVEQQSKTLLTTSFQPTDEYGQVRHGRPAKTLLELVLDKSVEWLSTRVGKDGTTTWGEKDRTRAEFLAQKAAESLIKEQLQPEIEKAKKSVQEAFQGQLQIVFKQAIKDCIK